MKLIEIISALNDNLSKEYGAILLYIELRRQPKIARNERIAAMISSLAEDEMNHAEMLADKVAELGGQSTWQIEPFEKKTTVVKSLIQVVETEEMAIRDYSSLIGRLKGQPKLQAMLKVILADEVRHKMNAEKLLRPYLKRPNE